MPDDSADDIEAAIERRLASWQPTADIDIDAEPPARPKRRRVRKSRRRAPPSDATAAAAAAVSPKPPPAAPAPSAAQATAPIRSAADAATADATRRAAALSLVGARRRAPAALPKAARAVARGSGAARVVRAAELPLPVSGRISKRARKKRADRTKGGGRGTDKNNNNGRAESKRKSKSKSNGEDEDAAAFVDAHRRDVARFGASGLDKKARTAFQNAELARLGCRAPRNQKMPIGLLQARRAREKADAKRDREEAIASGMLVRSKRKQR